MRIAILIAEGVMTTMGRYPEEDRTFRRHGTQNGQNGFRDRLGLKCPVRQLAVKTYADTENGDRVKEK